MQEVGRLAKRIVRTGKILLIITHDYEFIQTICSRVLVLEGWEKYQMIYPEPCAERF